MKRSSIYIILVTILLSFFGAELLAQCPMCKLAAQSNLENGGTAGSGLNQGILYMLAMPYVIIGLIGYLWWTRNGKAKEAEAKTK